MSQVDGKRVMKRAQKKQQFFEEDDLARKVYVPKKFKASSVSAVALGVYQFLRPWLWGAVFFTLVAIMAFALERYNPAWDSWTTINTDILRVSESVLFLNAVIDIFLQVFGGGVFLIMLAFVCWGFTFWIKKHIALLKTKIFLMLLGVVFLSSSIALFCSVYNLNKEMFYFPAGIGGGAGRVVAHVLSKLIKIDQPVFSMPFSIMFLFIGVTLYTFSLGRTFLIGIYRKLSPIFAVFKAIGVFIKNLKMSKKDEYEDIFDQLDELEPSFEKEKELRPKMREPKKRKIVETEEYVPPSLELLSMPGKMHVQLSKKQLEERSDLLMQVLSEFGVRGRMLGFRPGPVVTLFEFEPAAGVKSARIIGLADDIARSMSARSARVSVVPGRNAMGIELPNETRETVYFREILANKQFSESSASLPIGLGKDIGGTPVVADLAKMPHLLVAGTTGSGKSVGVNAMILSLIYKLSPEECKFIMIDPKMLELSIYDGIPHLLSPVVTDPKKAVVALKWVVQEMESRYRAMAQLSVRNIHGYNEKIRLALAKGTPLTRSVQVGFDPDSGLPEFEEQALDMTPFPFIVVVVDEMADLMLVAGKEIESAVQRLAQMARASGIHLIMATQRPSVDVITGTIKANFPTRIAFQVTSKIDSRTILGEQGAEQLLGRGDMLFMEPGGHIVRVHGAFVADNEVEQIVAEVKQNGVPSYKDIYAVSEEEEGYYQDTDSGAGSDEMYDKALSIVLSEGKVSTSFIQRQLSIGYNRAAKIVEQMEKQGIVSAPSHTGKRDILVPHEKKR